MTMEKEKLDEIIANHGRWLRDEGGKRAYLRGADLRHADLCGADLSHADLCGANLREAELEGANLSHADLYGADLCETELEGANLPIGIYQIVGPGSCNRCTTYDTINNQIICGCWDDGKGNHLDSFIKRIEEVYGPYEEGHHSIYYTEYMAAVNFFKAMKELKENHDKQGQI